VHLVLIFAVSIARQLNRAATNRVHRVLETRELALLVVIHRLLSRSIHA
jgi:hypothetical protein